MVLKHARCSAREQAGPCVSRRQPTHEPSEIEETRIRLSHKSNTLTKTVTVAKKQVQVVALAKILGMEKLELT
jgi:hypothetical protein